MQDNPIELYDNLTRLFKEKDDIMAAADKIISEMNKKRELFRQCNNEINAINIKSISNSVVSYDAFRLHQKRKELMEELSKLEHEALNLKDVKNDLDKEIEEIRSKLMSMTPVVEDDKPKSIYVEALDDNVTISTDNIDLTVEGAPLSKANEVVIYDIREVYEKNSISVNIPEEEIIKNRELSEFETEVKSYTTEKNREIDDQLKMLQGVFESSEDASLNDESEKEKVDTKGDDTLNEEREEVSAPEVEENKEETTIINIEQQEENKPVINLEDVQTPTEPAIEEKPVLESSPTEEKPISIIQETPSIEQAPQNIVSLSDLGLNTTPEVPTEPIKVDSLEELENINNINNNDNVINVDFNKNQEEKSIYQKEDGGKSVAKMTIAKCNDKILPIWDMHEHPKGEKVVPYSVLLERISQHQASQVESTEENANSVINFPQQTEVASENNETPESVEMTNNEETSQINTQDPGFSLESFTQGTEKKAA